MTAVTNWQDAPSRDWTTNDLDALPEDGQRRELVDGVLIVSPSPLQPHQTIAMLLGAKLYRGCPQQYRVTQAVEVRINQRRSLIPDVLAVTAEASARRGRLFAPHEVVLAVEIVSPTSMVMDRVTKPALYAQARIPYYWRVETDEKLTVHTHRLDPVDDIYEPTGQFSEWLETTEPWDIMFPITEIDPDYRDR